MADIESFNKLLKSVKNVQDLVDIYQNYAPDMVKEVTKKPIDNLYYCSGAAELVIRYFCTKKKVDIVSLSTDAAKNGKLTKSNVDQVHSLLDSLKEPFIGYLEGGDPSHIATFIGMPKKSQWAFYQANYGKSEESVTLAPLLNPSKANWCFNKMDANNFKSFFTGLTNKSRNGAFFPFADPAHAWFIAVVSFAGTQLLHKDDLG